MITIRKAQDRGHANHGWLDTHFTFSFANYHDPQHMGFRALRVINEDFIEGGKGFGMHPHRDMEIISVVLEGALEHKDSLGSGSVIRPGDVQRMTAGTGILHSEFNPLPDQRTHLLQIWIEPEQAGLKPSYEEQHFDSEARTDRLALVASKDARDGSMTIHQDAAVYVSTLTSGTELQHALGKDRHAWVQVTSGSLTVNGVDVTAGDGLRISGQEALTLLANTDASLILFDLA